MSLTSQNTAFASGVTNCFPWQAMAEAGIPDPSFSQLYHEEFNVYRPGDFTVTNLSTGTQALSPEVGGVLQLTTAATGADSTFLQLPVAGFQFLTGAHHWFKARIRLSAGLACDAYAGLIATGTNPIAAPVNGLFFFKAQGSLTWVLRSVVAGVTTDFALPVANVVADTVWAEVSFHIGSLGEVEAFFNPTTGGFTPVASGLARGRVASIPATYLISQSVMAPSFGIRNSGAAQANTLKVDYITMSSEI